MFYTNDLILIHEDFINRINLVRQQTIDKFLENNLQPSEEEIINVEFCILLTHGAIEEYIEECCKIMAETMYKIFIETNIPNECILSLAYFCNQKIENEDINYKDIFLYHSKIIKKSKEELHRRINKNNGISSECIQKLLSCVGLSIFSGKMETFINELSKKRGHAAHKFRGIATAYKTMTAQDAVEITVDAIELANYLKKNIEQKILNYLYIVNIVKTNKQVELINCVRQIQAKKDKL